MERGHEASEEKGQVKELDVLLGSLAYVLIEALKMANEFGKSLEDIALAI